jgi:6-pyruvoyltetrahydropterin/6-carboxytetrahydropterin synthase
MRGLGRYYELRIRCRGPVDEQTGYFINIKDIDRAARSVAIPFIAEACRERPSAEPGELLPEMLSRVSRALDGRLTALTWHLTPYYCVEMETGSLGTVLLRQRFDFAAAHRLHVPGLSAAENRTVFGKCNNPNGHGHNYQVEPCVAVELVEDRQGFTLADLERITSETVIGRFDHTHLNLDTEEFNARTGLNPSVEHIASVCFGLLREAITLEGRGAQLRSVTVWETDKTSCTYPAEC